MDPSPVPETRKKPGPPAIAAIALGALLVVALAGLLVQHRALARARTQAAEATAALEDATGQLEAALRNNDYLEADLEAARSAQQALKADVARLDEEIAAAREENATLSAEVARLTEEVDRLKAEKPAEAEAPSDAGQALPGDMVYVSVLALAGGNFTGQQYHEYGCAKLDATYYAAVPKSLTKMVSMKPCPVCH